MSLGIQNVEGIEQIQKVLSSLQPSINSFTTKLPARVKNEFPEMAEVHLMNAKLLAPVHTGMMKSTMFVTVNEGGWEIGAGASNLNGVRYFVFQDEGYTPHVIPRRYIAGLENEKGYAYVMKHTPMVVPGAVNSGPDWGVILELTVLKLAEEVFKDVIQSNK